jgi:hypothetical protein
MSEITSQLSVDVEVFSQGLVSTSNITDNIKQLVQTLEMAKKFFSQYYILFFIKI